MSIESQVRSESRYVLSKNWIKPALTTFFILLLFMFCECFATQFGLLSNYANNHFSESNPFYLEVIYRSIYVLSIIIPNVVFIFISPFINGLQRFYYTSKSNGDFDMNDIVYFFKKGKFFKTIGLNLSFIIRMIIPSILFSLPVLVYVGICAFLIKDFRDSDMYYAIFGILIFLSCIMIIIYALKYFLVNRLYIENENLKIKEYYKTSVNIMHNNVTNIIKLFFSFFPWLLLSLLVLPLFYVVPYMSESFAISANYLISLEKESISNESIPMYDSVQ